MCFVNIPQLKHRPAGSTSTGHEPLLDTLVRNQRIQGTIGMMLCNEDASGSKLTLGAPATDTSSAQRIFKTDMGAKRHYTVKFVSMAINNVSIGEARGISFFAHLALVWGFLLL